MNFDNTIKYNAMQLHNRRPKAADFNDDGVAAAADLMTTWYIDDNDYGYTYADEGATKI